MKIDTVDSITANYQEDKTLFINSAFSRTSSLFKKSKKIKLSCRT